ncbi:hypothetical protein DMENIID0001_157110 [Sergentomyia squamirostris]
MEKIKVEKDEECDLEMDIKVENVEKFDGELIYVNENSKNSPIKNCSIHPVITEGMHSMFEEKNFISNQTLMKQEVQFDQHENDLNEDHEEVRTEITFGEEKFLITENLADYEDSSGLTSEIKVEEEEIQVTELNVEGNNQETNSVASSKKPRIKKKLNYHVKQYHEEKRFECAYCGKMFSMKEYLVRHIGCHSTLRRFPCHLCPSRFKRNHDRTIHERSVHGEDDTTFECHICSKKYKTKSQLNRHVKVVHNKKSFKCSFCSNAYKTNFCLTKHMETHNTDANHQCFHCGNYYMGQRHLDDHINQHHNRLKYFCAICSIFVKTKCQLNDHNGTSEHEQNRLEQLKTGIKTNTENCLVAKFEDKRDIIKIMTENHECNICGKTLKTKQNLWYHMKTHADKTYQCKICNISFPNGKRLTYHRMKNHKEKSFECDHCGKMFPIKSLLNTHIVQHNSERQFPCNICLKKFIDKYTLDKHLKTVHGIGGPGKFDCPICSRKYIRADKLSNHMKAFHDPLRKVFACSICPKPWPYKTEQKMKEHMETHKTE